MPISVGGIGLTNVGRFAPAPVRAQFYSVSGVTRDSAGAPLGYCVVQIFESATNVWRGSTTSNASGNYKIEIAGDRTIQLKAAAYLPGPPDVAGTTVNTLIAS